MIFCKLFRKGQLFRNQRISHFVQSRNTVTNIHSTHCSDQFNGGASSSKSTIYALSSGQGKCGVAVVRISGSKALNALQKMTCINNLKPRKAFLRHICDPETGEIIDKGLCLWFPGPHSFTGEDSVEFQVHGGSAILHALFSALSKLGLCPASPGEFTKRAFFNKKLDLTEVEGLIDLIHAETEMQRKQALLQANGSLRKIYTTWRHLLLQCTACMEAYIDFSEDDNIEHNVLDNCNVILRDVAKQIKDHLSDERRGEILRNGIRTIILGEPNVGKSSLFNTLVHRDAVIVTPIAGTTRDIVELNVNISGYPIILADTAGLTSSENVVEKEGIRRARLYAENANFIILVVDGLKFMRSGLPYEKYINSYIQNLGLKDLLIKDDQLCNKCIIVINKTDLLKNVNFKNYGNKKELAAISCQTNDGIQDLLQLMAKRFERICGNPNEENPTISQLRYRIHLKQCLQNINDYFDIISVKDYDMAIANQKIREAMRELGKITGHITLEQILDTIFENFCIGK